MDLAVNKLGSIFDAQPAKIPGNVFSFTSDEPLLGYFEVVNADTTSLELGRNGMPFFVRPLCRSGR